MFKNPLSSADSMQSFKESRWYLNYIAVGGNKHPAAADWDPRTGIVAYGSQSNIALWDPPVTIISPIHINQAHLVVSRAITGESQSYFGPIVIPSMQSDFTTCRPNKASYFLVDPSIRPSGSGVEGKMDVENLESLEYCKVTLAQLMI